MGKAVLSWIGLGALAGALAVPSAWCLAGARVAAARPVSSVRAANGLRVVRVSGGLEIALALRRRTYPRNALIQARVELTNVAGSTMYVSAVDCPSPGPEVQVDVLSGGNVVYPPAINPFIEPSWGNCPTVVPMPRGKITRLAPGATLIARPYVILRGTLLRVVAVAGAHPRPSWWHRVIGPEARVTLTAAQEPALHLHTSTAYTYAQLVPLPAARGPMLYMSSTLCGPSAEQSSAVDSFRWQTRRNDRVFPACPSGTVEWRLAAGWLGQSIVMFDYRRQ